MTLLVLAIWLSVWIVGMAALRIRGARKISPAMPTLVIPCLVLWLGWVWLR